MVCPEARCRGRGQSDVGMLALQNQWVEKLFSATDCLECLALPDRRGQKRPSTPIT